MADNSKITKKQLNAAMTKVKEYADGLALGGDGGNISIPVFSDTNSHASKPLDIKTYAGGEDQPMHPKVLYFEGGWNGYKYWMAYTPLPNEDNENPCIAASNDMINWVTPEGLENPLAFKPETGGYNSDTHLVYIPSTRTLECWYRRIYTGVSKEEFYRRTSTDGVNWTQEELCFTSTGSITANLSPCLIFEENKYKMWTFSNSNKFNYYESNTGSNDWNKIKEITLPTDNDNKLITIWHADIIHTTNGYEMISYNNNGTIHYSKSVDNDTFSKPILILEKTSDSTKWDGENLYRSSFILKDGCYYVFYSGKNKTTAEWKIGLTKGENIYKLKGYNGNRILSLKEAILDLYSKIGLGSSTETTTIEVQSISLNKTEIEVKKGKNIEIIATISPNNATNKTITWTTDNESIATVKNGIVTAIENGSCNITATTNNNKTATCKVTVSDSATETTDGMVEENLVCWLDGRDGSGNNVVWHDRTGNGNDVTLNNFKFNSDDGWANNGLRFDGIEDYAVGDHSKLSSITYFATVCLNVTIEEEPGSKQQDIYAFKIGNGGRFLLYNNSLSIQTRTIKELQPNVTVGTYDIVYTFKYDISQTSNQHREAVYLNGSLIKEEIGNVASGIVLDNFTIGSEGGTTNFAKVKVNSIKIYNAELTEEQILRNYNYEQKISR